MFLVGFPPLVASQKTDVNSEANLSAVARSSECLANIRAVRTLPGAAKKFHKLYARHVLHQRKNRVRQAPTQAILYSLAYTFVLNIQSVLYLTLIPIFVGGAFSHYGTAATALDQYLDARPDGLDPQQALINLLQEHKNSNSWPAALLGLDPFFEESYASAQDDFTRISLALAITAFAGLFMFPSIMILATTADGWVAAHDVFEVTDYQNKIRIEDEKSNAGEEAGSSPRGLGDDGGCSRKPADVIEEDDATESTLSESTRLLLDNEFPLLALELGSAHDEETVFPDAEPISSIRFEDVRFRYPARPAAAVLQGFSVEIEAGMSVAFVGPSGGGKSTSVALLARFYDPSVLSAGDGGRAEVSPEKIGETEVEAWSLLSDDATSALDFDTPVAGRLVVNGKYSLREISLKSWRKRLGYVGQEPVLFNISARDNVTLGLNREITQDELRKVASLACIDFLSDDVSTGLLSWDEPLGLKGCKLSGGQKQRVAIARALIRKPQLLLLDEATSALDNKSEREVQKAIDNIMANSKGLGLITVTIAHKLSTVVNSDKIVCIVEGRNVEEGTHAQLLAKKGFYYGLAQLAM